MSYFPAGGDLTGGFPNPTLNVISTVTPATYGTSTQIASIEVDNKGRVIAASLIPIDGGGGTTSTKVFQLLAPYTYTGTVLPTNPTVGNIVSMLWNGVATTWSGTNPAILFPSGQQLTTAAYNNGFLRFNGGSFGVQTGSVITMSSKGYIQVDDGGLGRFLTAVIFGTANVGNINGMIATQALQVLKPVNSGTVSTSRWVYKVTATVKVVTYGGAGVGQVLGDLEFRAWRQSDSAFYYSQAYSINNSSSELVPITVDLTANNYLDILHVPQSSSTLNTITVIDSKVIIEC